MPTATTEPTDTAATIGSTVYLAVIEHKHGDNVSVHTSETGAAAAVLAFVNEWWDNEMTDDNGDPLPTPDDPTERVEQYFEHVEHEHYTVTATVLLP